MSDNPFEVLRLDPSATEEEIVRRAGELRRTAADEERTTALRQAVHALTGKPEDRRLAALLTHPSPQYDWPALDRLRDAFRRPPPSLDVPTTEVPTLDAAELAALLRPFVLQWLAEEPLPFEMPPIEETPAEVLRQTLEALERVLPFEMMG